MLERQELSTQHWPMHERFHHEKYNATCPRRGIILNAMPEGHGGWETSDRSTKHAFLCQAPNYPKMRCPNGYYYVAQTRRCLHFHFMPETVIFPTALEYCRRRHSLLAGIDDHSQNYIQDMINDIYNNHGRRPDCALGALGSYANHSVNNLDGHPYRGFTVVEDDLSHDDGYICMYASTEARGKNVAGKFGQTIYKHTRGRINCTPSSISPSYAVLYQRFADVSGTDTDERGNLIDEHENS